MIPRVLSIAGTDPTGGAGIQADLKSIAAAGGYGMAVVTALVAQNTHGVRSIHTPPVSFLREQLDAVSDDVQIDAVKIGMLGTVEVIDTVAAWLRENRPPVVVLDPVMVATSGDRLITEEAVDALRSLCTLADLVTPNIPELALLAGSEEASEWDEVIAQAEQVSRALGVQVLAKGGHLEGTNVPDALVDARDDVATVAEFENTRVDTVNTHGTGCSLSSGIATRRALIGNWFDALAETKLWITESLAHADGLLVGSGHGPINHFAGLWSRGGVATRPTPAQVAEAWWDAIEDVREEIDELEFIRDLGAGTLDADAFTWYLAQDAIYLREYARVLAEAARLAPTEAEQAFWAKGAYGAIAAEMDLHRSWLGESAPVEPSATTTAYLNHLLAASASGDYGVIVAAVLPCYWLYQDVGTRLHRQRHDAHAYASWLDTYADESFAEATREAIAIVTSVAARASAEQHEAMLRAFIFSSEHEREFFAAPLS